MYIYNKFLNSTSKMFYQKENLKSFFHLEIFHMNRNWNVDNSANCLTLTSGKFFKFNTNMQKYNLNLKLSLYFLQKLALTVS